MLACDLEHTIYPLGVLYLIWGYDGGNNPSDRVTVSASCLPLSQVRLLPDFSVRLEEPLSAFARSWSSPSLPRHSGLHLGPHLAQGCSSLAPPEVGSSSDCIARVTVSGKPSMTPLPHSSFRNPIYQLVCF